MVLLLWPNPEWQKVCQDLYIGALLYIVQLKPHKASLLIKSEKKKIKVLKPHKFLWHQIQALYYFLCVA